MSSALIMNHNISPGLFGDHSKPLILRLGQECSDLIRKRTEPLICIESNYMFVTSRKAGQHVLLVQGQGGQGQVTFSFLETSVQVQPL